jgi:hypothetical protein
MTRLPLGRLVVALLAAAVLAGCASLGTPRPPPPTLEEIVALSKSGAPAADIIKRMEEARAVYRLPASELARLREQGVPDAVIDHMQRTFIEEERFREWVRSRDMYWYGWPYHGFYGPWRYGPYPYSWRPYHWR